MLRGHIIYKGSPEVKAKAFRGIVKEGMREILDFWHNKYLPKHFTKAGAREYKYEDRSSTHMKKKIKYYRHADPLVYTGDMKKMLKQMLFISGTAKKATGKMRGPKYLHTKGRNQPDKADEITRISRPEIQIFAQRMDKHITKKINAVKTTKTKRF